MAINDPSFSHIGGPAKGQTQGDNPLDHASRMAAEARAFGRSLSATGARLNSNLDLAGRVQRNPIGSVLVALGVGYLLGGGLFSPVTKKALKVGLRLAVIPFVKGQISALAGGHQAGEPL